MTIRSWSTTAASNNSAVPNGAPEGMAPSGVNNVIRQVMAEVRDTFEQAPYFDYGHTPTRVDADTFTVATDLTATYSAGRHVKLVGASTEYGIITSSSYSAPNTTVNISGTVPTSLSTVSISFFAQAEYRRTATEIAAGVTPGNNAYNAVPEDVRRWGAVDTGGNTDSTDEIIDAFDALNAGTISGGGVVIPGDANSVYNISSSITIPARSSGDNHSRWYSFNGIGRGAPRITAKTGLANSSMVNGAGQDSSTYSFYREYMNMYLNGNGIAQTGIDARYTQHGKFENLFITGLDDGSGTAKGINFYGFISGQIRDVKIHDGDGHGLYAVSFFNANLIEGCSMLNLTGSGIYASDGFSGCAVIGNTLEDCQYGMYLSGISAGGSVVIGNYIEDNEIADIYFGTDTAMKGLLITGNYFNGYTLGGGTGVNYTPIKTKYADGCWIRNNIVAVTAKSANGYLFLDANISGGGVSNCVVEDNQVNGLDSTTPPNTIYNIKSNWVYQGNSLFDRTFVPLIEHNMCGLGRLPFGWTISVTGTGTVVRGDDLLGSPAIQMDRPAASTCIFSKIVSLQSNQSNRFVTLTIPVVDLVGTGKSITISATPNGTSPATGLLTESSLSAQKIYFLSTTCFAPSDATQITVEISLGSTGSSFLVGHPCLYVGAKFWYSATTYQHWVQSGVTAPTTGTWVRGDIIWRSDATSAAAPGIMCTVSGAPGTWVAMANLA